jgi:hypothetical protein
MLMAKNKKLLCRACLTDEKEKMNPREQFHISLLVASVRAADEVISPEKWFSLSLFFEIDCIRFFYSKMWSDLDDF